MFKQKRKQTATITEPSSISDSVVEDPITSGPSTATMPDSPSTPASFTMIDVNISDTDYARSCKELMALHSDLSNLGAGDLLDLPRIVVIGGQSAGKSSLVEAVSGISVPRDSGTCTRCPMECSMSTSAEGWSCDISLRFDYDDYGNRLPASRIESFGPRLTSKGEMEIWLRRAQAAILSPHLHFQSFISKSVEELRGTLRADTRVLKFSKNSVCVDIRDPDATVLSFVDLPGLIQNEAPDIIELVKEMVVDKIAGEKSENTLILITIPMSDDMENQQAVRLAREADNEGRRTIGVLTKPDTLTQGAINSRQKWKDVIQGETHRLQHGYYCVRLLDDEERTKKTPRSDSQRLEEEFFMSTSPWNGMIEQRRFGIPIFVNDISKLLVNMIEKNLPKLKEDVVQLLNSCHSELEKLPAPVINEPSAEILLRVTKFCNDLHSAVYGDISKQFTQENRSRYEQFKFDILNTAPDFRPFLDYKNYIKPSILDDEMAPTSRHRKKYGLMDVRNVIKRSIAWELPGHVPFDATKTLILEFTSNWRNPSIECFNSVFNNLSAIVDHLLGMHFGQFKQLHSYMSSLTAVEIDSGKQETLRTLNKVLNLEQVPVFTQNIDFLESEEERWLSRYSDAQHNASRYIKPSPKAPEEFQEYVPQAFEAPQSPKPFNPKKKGKRPGASSRADYPKVNPDYNQQAVIEALAQAGYGSFTVEDLSQLLMPSEFREELGVMAKVRAYFQVAYKRVIDYVPLVIEHELNQSLVTRLQEILFQKLLKDSNSAENMRELLSEDPAIAKRREFLRGRANRLREIQQKLVNFRRESVAV